MRRLRLAVTGAACVHTRPGTAGVTNALRGRSAAMDAHNWRSNYSTRFAQVGGVSASIDGPPAAGER